jgi:hypothetical protein
MDDAIFSFPFISGVIHQVVDFRQRGRGKMPAVLCVCVILLLDVCLFTMEEPKIAAES